MRVFRIENTRGNGPYWIFSHQFAKYARRFAARKGLDPDIALKAWGRALILANAAPTPRMDVPAYRTLEGTPAVRDYIFGCDTPKALVDFFKPASLLYLALYHKRFYLAEYETREVFFGQHQVMFPRKSAIKIGKRKPILTLEPLFTPAESIEMEV